MKVLFINTVYGKGSTGRIIADLGRMLEENGHEYKVAYGRGDNSNDPHCYRIGNNLGVYIHAGLSRITDRSGFYSTGSTKKLIKFIKEYNPDIIHLHNLHGYYLNVEVLFNYLADEFKGRVIWTLHDCWAFTGHCVHFTYAKCDKWKTHCRNCPQKKEYPSSIVFDRSLKNYNIKKRLFNRVKKIEIITVSKWLEETVRQSFLSKNKVKTIYNGIDTDRFHYVSNNVKRELKIENKKMIFLVSDGWNDQKGYSKVLDVAEKAPSDWRFVMVGLTEKQLKKLPENIIGFERIWNQDKLIEFYSAADVFFNPSLEETFGLVTAEAIACGTPAVVMNSTSSPEIVYTEKNGKVLDVNLSCEKITREIETAFIKKNKTDIFMFSTVEFLKKYMELYLN